MDVKLEYNMKTDIQLFLFSCVYKWHNDTKISYENVIKQVTVYIIFTCFA
jgi:hypothetical protein